MTWAPQEFQKIVYETLSSDSQLQTLLNGTVSDKKIYDNVPENKVYPYVTIGDGIFEDRSNQSWRGWQSSPQINVWYRGPGRGKKAVQDIQARIDFLLNNIDVCVDGWNIIVFKCQTVDVVIEQDNVTLHGVQIFNLMLGEA